MIEPTHIIRPEGFEQPELIFNNVMPVFWVHAEAGLNKTEVLGPMEHTESEAIAAWNAMFTKAPKQYTAEPLKGDL